MESLIPRILIAFCVGAGGVIIMANQKMELSTKLIGDGALFMLIGINMLIYRPVMRILDQPAAEQ